jgi:hypothetical protein
MWACAGASDPCAEGDPLPHQIDCRQVGGLQGHLPTANTVTAWQLAQHGIVLKMEVAGGA